MLPQLITLDDLKNVFDVLKKIYDSVRIINPLRKKIIDFVDGSMSETPNSCYDIWSNGKICTNCISIRALNEKIISFKLDWAENKLFAVIAIPIQSSEDTLVLELLKDVTTSMVVDFPESAKKETLLQALYEFGQLQIKDSLTGIFNRRFIDERLPADIAQSSLNSIPISIVFTDIDHFKLVNDTYGHVAGDHILKEFAAILQNSIIGKDDWVARFGGEEFLVFLRNKNLTSAIELAEEIKSKVENREFLHGNNKIRITASFGVFTLIKNWDINTEDLINNVDKNLYAAKTSGRNRVIGSEFGYFV